MSKTLELILADWREKASTARSLKDSRVAGVIDELCDDVSRAAEDYLRFLAEDDARLHSGKSVGWLRARFPEWEATGNAKKDHGRRCYRAIVLPRKPDLIAARQAGLRGERPKERASLMARAKRRPLPDCGIRGRLGKRGRTVYGLVEKGLVRVFWSESGRRRMESWPDTEDNRAVARAFAEGLAKRLEQMATGQLVTYQPLTLREVWDAYTLAEFDHLRPRTRTNYRARWTKFETHIGRGTLATAVTREHLDEFRKALRKLRHEVNQIWHHVDIVKRVYRWAIDRDLIPPSKVSTYQVKRGRDEKALVIPEYRPEEARAILEQFDPRHPFEWRPYVATYLFAFAGPRQNAARQLTWDDVDLGGATILWRAEHDKLGKERVQQLPAPLVEALWVAYGWRVTFGYRGRYVLFGAGLATREFREGGISRVETARARRRAESKPDRPYSYQAFNARLVKAEKAAGVPHVPFRAAHGFRRYVVGQVLANTGNLALAGQYIGDSDIRTLQRSYVRERPEQLRGVADQLGGKKE